MHPDDDISQIELAYELGRDWWNQGLMTEAVKAIIDFFFNEIDLIEFMLIMQVKTRLPGK
jgi:RimJ/RimL family protein N-acetyltransferase